MNTALWILQILLGTMMLLLGLMKTFLQVERLKKFAWTTRSSKEFTRFVGISELLIGLGLILPQLTGILPILTSLAAFSLCIIMVLAIAEHVKNKETHEIGKNLIILVLAAFVAVGRLITL
jgi:uncharacterized membrane protein YhaH (DUF805 family)